MSSNRAASAATIASEPSSKPVMPLFLQLPEDEIENKFVNLFHLEWQRLRSTHDEWAQPSPDKNRDRYPNIIPWEKNRVKLQVPKDVNDYINASYVVVPLTLERPNKIHERFICMQGPMERTVDQVWQMVWHELGIADETSPAVIVMLCPTHAPVPGHPSKLSKTCHAYYPLDQNSHSIRVSGKTKHGTNFNATIAFKSRVPTVQNADIEIRELEMTVDGKQGIKPIWHFLYRSWPDHGVPKNSDIGKILQLLDLTRRQNSNDGNPRIIHCSAGVGRTGTFIALDFLVSQLRRGDWINIDQKYTHSIADPIYDIVNYLRTQRSHMVQTYAQYRFLYRIMRKLWVKMYQIPDARTETCTSSNIN
ncbi:protein tyrosine phosphatase [Blumeria hordei DH14]|uniref:Protein tyrosine phosphatase n=1 Tax=Blumeria graminis f. sp. hordei (strain DH14) TaxID=546991 RepID=N1J8B1_BLUG1|nr:protein tyrosine phosphatase [Blumeria hordei DH14]